MLNVLVVGQVWPGEPVNANWRIFIWLPFINLLTRRHVKDVYGTAGAAAHRSRAKVAQKWRILGTAYEVTVFDKNFEFVYLGKILKSKYLYAFIHNCNMFTRFGIWKAQMTLETESLNRTSWYRRELIAALISSETSKYFCWLCSKSLPATTLNLSLEPMPKWW